MRLLACALALSVTLAACDGPPLGIPPRLYALCQSDLMLDDKRCATAASWRLPDALPESRGNAYADDARAARLGHAIFYDASFATVPGVSCATCHLPDRAFADGVPVPEVIPGSPGKRNSPSLSTVAWNDGFFFWDGRADSLWSQPLLAFENELEMRTTRLTIAHRIATTYRADYEAIFGALPPLDEAARFPPSGKPGDAAWEAMTDADRDQINRVAANVGKALEAYMRKLATGPSAVDRYLDGERDALSPEARRGLVRFLYNGCGACHVGPLMSDGLFHPSTIGAPDDRGRAQGIEVLRASPFNGRGAYFDRDAGAPLPIPDAPVAADERAFRTPTMRNIAQTAPYQHDGSRTLEAILAVRGFNYEEGDDALMLAFLRALDGAPPPAEWAQPPR